MSFNVRFTKLLYGSDIIAYSENSNSPPVIDLSGS